MAGYLHANQTLQLVILIFFFHAEIIGKFKYSASRVLSEKKMERSLNFVDKP